MSHETGGRTQASKNARSKSTPGPTNLDFFGESGRVVRERFVNVPKRPCGLGGVSCVGLSVTLCCSLFV